MRKKYLSALLFGALLFASAGTFTSCKDYDDDINNLQEQIDKVAADLSDLAELVKNSGKGVTSVTFDEETGVLTVVTDGQTATYTVKTSATGSVNVEIKNGHLFVDGVDKGEVSGSKVTVVDGVLNIDGEPAGLEVGSKVVIAKGNGVYQLTVDGETIELPMAAASISYIDVINGDKQMNALYDINKTDVLEHINTEHVADLDFLIEVADFHDGLLWLAGSGLELTSIRLRGAALLQVTGGKHSGAVAIGFLRPAAHDDVVLYFYDSHRCEDAIGVKDLRHSNLFADKP